MKSKSKAQIEIISGEGTGKGNIEKFKGTISARGFNIRLNKEREGGDRWAFIRIFLNEYNADHMPIYHRADNGEEAISFLR